MVNNICFHTNAWRPCRAAGNIEWWSLSLLQKNSVISSTSFSLNPFNSGINCSKILAIVNTVLHRWVACWWSKSDCKSSTSWRIVNSFEAIAEKKTVRVIILTNKDYKTSSSHIFKICHTAHTWFFFIPNFERS